MGILLNKLAELKKRNQDLLQDEEIDINFDGEIKPFDFEDERYYLAVRDEVLIFDKNMVLIYTLTKEQVVESNVPLINRAAEILAKKDEALVKLFIKRNGTFERLSFYNRFDAIFIMKKMKRVALRPDENIEEIFIEDDGAIVEHYKSNGWQRRFTRNVFHRKKESNTVMQFVDVEDTLENLISELINGSTDDVDIAKVDECIEMLQKLKNNKENK